MNLHTSSYLFDMFSVERQHRRVKCHAETIKNNVCFERSVLLRVLDSQMLNLQEGFVIDDTGLHGRRERSTCNGIAVTVADHLVCNGSHYHCDDIVARGSHFGVVIACYQTDDGTLHVLVELMRATATPECYEHTAERELWPPAELSAATAWMPSESAGVFRIIS